MIYRIHGTVSHKGDNFIVVDVGSLGLSLQVAQVQAFTLGSDYNLFVHMHWNQDQGPSFYGFSDQLDKAVFLLVTGCSGLGPKLALAILSYLGASQFLHAVYQEQEAILSKVPGVGAKKAEQIIVQLRGKVTKLFASGTVEDNGAVAQLSEVSQALASLSYTQTEVSAAMRFLGAKTDCAQLPFDQLMRQALSFLTKKP
jgi:Holliday junction DNA helicase RuvA